MKGKAEKKRRPEKKVKWYGIEEGGNQTVQFADLEENYLEIFDELREGKIPETTDEKERIPDLREKLIGYGRKRIKDEFSEDQFIIKMFGLRMEMDRIINLYLERVTVLEHLSGFPEYGNDPCRFFALIGSDVGDPGIGRILKDISESGVQMCNLRGHLSSFIQERIAKVMPNTVALIGSELASEILFLGGGLKNVAGFPSSTIQVLGADKAFFKHMKSGTPPPKHGVLFKFPGISSMPAKRRGKVARTLAGKIAITARADYFHGSVDVESMKRVIEERMAERSPV